MNQLSGTTQQTASASEQLSATAEELTAQAEQLQDLIASFRLDNAASAGSTRAAQAPANAPRVASLATPATRKAAATGHSHQGKPLRADIEEDSFVDF